MSAERVWAGPARLRPRFRGGKLEAMSEPMKMRRDFRGQDWFAATLLVQFAVGCGLVILEATLDRAYPPVSSSVAAFFSQGIWEAAGGGALVAVFVAVLIPIDLAAQRSRGIGRPDLAYFPRPAGFRRALSVMPARLAGIVGFLLLTGWWVHTQLQREVVYTFAGGMVHGPPRILIGGLMVWGLLWVVDCLTRPEGGTIVAASIFLFFAAFCAYAVDGNVLRE
jgi:hypothetical protein